MKIESVNSLKAGRFNVALLILIILILGLFTLLSISANIDLSAGRFALFMDERITFDGVKKILHSPNYGELLKAVVEGDQRYGRSLWISIAAASFLPERIWGEPGQIIASRLLQVLLIESSCLILAFGLIENWLLRLVLIISILTIPFSDWYVSLPKAEPLQLFFLSIFCLYYFKNNLKFGWYWLFAGLAFGTKISTLPSLVIFSLFSLVYSEIPKTSFRMNFWTPLEVSVLSFSIGLGLAVPILITPILYLTSCYFGVLFLSKKLEFGRSLKIIILAVTTLPAMYIFKNSIQAWLLGTFLNTKHGADQSSTTFLTWIEYFFNEWMVAPQLIGRAFALISLFFIFYFSIFTYKKRGEKYKNIAALAIALAGAILNVSIIFGAKRLWGFYLYPGAILFICGLLMMVNLSLNEISLAQDRARIQTLKALACVITFGLLLISTLFWGISTVKNLESLSGRTQTKDYGDQLKSYNQILTFLNFPLNVSRKPAIVMLTPSLFPPVSNDNYQILEFGGPYDWNQSADVIILGLINTPRGTNTPKDSPLYERFLLERQGYFEHIAEKGGKCRTKPCYEKVLTLVNGGEILVLIK